MCRQLVNLIGHCCGCLQVEANPVAKARSLVGFCVQSSTALWSGHRDRQLGMPRCWSYFNAARNKPTHLKGRPMRCDSKELDSAVEIASFAASEERISENARIAASTETVTAIPSTTFECARTQLRRGATIAVSITAPKSPSILHAEQVVAAG